MADVMSKDLLKAKKLVESVIKGLGIDPDKNHVIAADGGAAWQVSRGSADIMIALNPSPRGASGRMRVISPVVKFKDEVPRELSLKLLELNGTVLPGVAFGLLSGNMVVLVSERSVVELDKAEIEEILTLIGFFADKYDDLLVNEFGGTRVCDI